MADELWEKAISLDGLRAGWHLTRAETRSDFIQDYLSVESFGYNLNTQIAEIRRQLITDAFEPRTPIRVEVPKGPMGIRPGTLLPISDRTVLYAFIKEIAPVLDKLIPPGVYSYRVKEKIAKGELFRESDALDVPFLKKDTIQAEIDPTDAWYSLWPKFNEKTKEAMSTGYRYLSVSDISAYFENINLPILRDIFMENIPSEQKIINVMMRCLETWTVKTEHGYRPLRGIHKVPIFVAFSETHIRWPSIGSSQRWKKASTSNITDIWTMCAFFLRTMQLRGVAFLIWSAL